VNGADDGEGKGCPHAGSIGAADVTRQLPAR
jgi:hypothetical protein